MLQVSASASPLLHMHVLASCLLESWVMRAVMCALRDQHAIECVCAEDCCRHAGSEGCTTEGRPATHHLAFHLCLLPPCEKGSTHPLALNLFSARPHPIVSCTFDSRIIECMV